ncbi:WD40/YVTN/BNR-like repeat-containing protein [Sediminicola luteus]|uniref:Glycosyl hydrolase n=1 Tax=Sediminicola luteus TaxID=319238 RepID=A0A2A4GF03_9FLAO|nr:exo-alpha-sialidase [Sediminicola luteus]PCE66322.1 glycosyl hydrolase [Sediminicola luteus]
MISYSSSFTPLRFFGLCFCLFLSMASAQTTDEDLGALKFRFVGPEGNRTIAVAGVPGDPMVNYIGAASGGLWKTTDGGIQWKSIFDGFEVSSVSALALAPSNPDTVWVGTGETFLIRPAHAMGDGVYRSTDAGKTWQKMGLDKTGRIARIVVHPTDANIVYVAALGHAYGPQEERGLYKTTDGGKSWKLILHIDENTGASDIILDPQNPDRLMVGMWSIHINTWGLNSGGPGGGVYRSLDGGKTWQAMHTNGLPGGAKRPVGKTGLALSHKTPDTVYALFEIDSPALYRSDDFGNSWTLVSRDHSMNERAPYYTRMAVSTDNSEELYFLNVKFGSSKDGGNTFTGGYAAGGDNHDMWIDPTNADRMIVAHDGGTSISLNRGKSWQRIVLPIAQMYHVAVDDQIPYNLYGNRQDGYSYKGPSNSLQGYIPIGLWQGVGGCESGFARPDPFDNNIVWSGCYDGGLERYNAKTGHAQDVRVWPEAGYGWAPADMKYRWYWNFPLSFSPHTPHRVYVGSQFVHKSDDNGHSWQIISPDLTKNKAEHQQASGGIAVDNLMTFDAATLMAIEESPVEPGHIWVGSNDGSLHLSKNGGGQWENLSDKIPVLRDGAQISSIQVSKHQKGTAFVTIDLHQMGDFDPHIYMTQDHGQNWKAVGAGIPKSVHSFAHVVKEDPKKPGMLYVGVDNGVYVSHNYGNTWMRLRLNLPPAPVYWLDIQERFDDLVICTYGRGYYILDNLEPIRKIGEAKADAAMAHLFALRPAYRFHNKQAIKTDGPSFNSGKNPAYGADINYFLKDSTEADIQIQILSSEKEVVRTLKGTGKKGINRVMWDLRYEPTYKPKLRTSPPGRPWVQLNGEGWRPLVTWDLDLWRGQFGPKVVPDTYSVKLIIEGQEYTQKVAVLKDPDSEGDLESITKQVALSLELRDAINQAVEMINSVEVLRKELEALLPELKRPADKRKAQQMLVSAEGIAGALYDIHLTGAREDAFRSPMRLYGRLSALASDLTGHGIDFEPTEQQQAVFNVFDQRLQQSMADYERLVQKDLEALNKQLRKSKLEIDAQLKM